LHQWGAVTSFHGLPSDRAHAIAQTEFGVTWFATDGGLARYDGRRTNSITGEGLPPGRILALKADADGSLWIGTENGATRLANGRFEAIKETTGKVITAIITPAIGHAIMASESGVIFDCQVSPSENSSVSRVVQTSVDSITSVTFVVRVIPAQPLQGGDADHPGALKITSLTLVGEKLYAGTQSRGVLLIENGAVTEIVSKPRPFTINALETDARGHLWVGARTRVAESGLFDSSEPLKPSKISAPTGPVMAITRGTHDDLWVGTDGRGAFHLQGGKPAEHFTFEGTGGALRSDHIFGIFVDPEEVIWFATDKGVCRYDPHATRAENLSDDPATNYVRALWRSTRGHLLAGTNAGLFAYEATTKKWSPLAELGRRTIYAINEDRNGRILVATATGLFASAGTDKLSFSRLGTDERSAANDSVRAIAITGDATYVATYGYGVEKLQGAQRTLIWPEPSAADRLREIVSLTVDAGGRLLIGTSTDGLFFFDGKQTRTEGALDRLKGDAIWSVVPEGAGLWLATGRGLYSFQGGQLREIAGGVNARSIVAVGDSSRGGQIWCATVGNGLLRVSLDEQFGSIVSRLDVEQGLPSQRVFAVLSERNPDGGESVIAGTNRGIVRYEPGRVAPTVLPARVISQRIHQPRELTAGLQLDYPQNSLLLDVTAISSRTFPEQFQYAFALYDQKGQVIREKLAHDSQFPMEKLKPGRYKVVARAFTKDLLASTPLSFEFNVAKAPFPWTSTALAVLLAMALLALLWAVLEHRRIVRTSAALVEANRELAGARLDLANEAERERRRIARDLHDQTLADLRRLLLIADRLPGRRDSGQLTQVTGERDSANGESAFFDPAIFRKEIESVSNEIRRICEDLSPSVLDNVGLTAALEWALGNAVVHLPPEKKFAFAVFGGEEIEEQLNLDRGVRIQIYRIAQEVINNICRHAQAKQVRLSLQLLEGGLTLAIEDDGQFFAPGAEQDRGRGLANIHARASLIEAHVAWTERAGGGTRFVLSKS
jgi:signal transduction histidine kinase/ligand-binding sensor domain-containing protein